MWHGHLAHVWMLLRCGMGILPMSGDSSESRAGCPCHFRQEPRRTRSSALQQTIRIWRAVRSLGLARDPDPFDSAQGHPEPACGVADPELVERELVEPVERMSLSNGRHRQCHPLRSPFPPRKQSSVVAGLAEAGPGSATPTTSFHPSPAKRVFAFLPPVIWFGFGCSAAATMPLCAHPPPPVNQAQRLIARRAAFRRALHTWYSKHHRQLPWRTQPSLYWTVVSEFMLQ